MHGFARIDRFTEQILDGARALQAIGGPGIAGRRGQESARGVVYLPKLHDARLQDVRSAQRAADSTAEVPLVMIAGDMQG